MSNFSNLVITKTGTNLMNTSFTEGKKITFVNMVASDCEYKQEEIEELTEISDVRHVAKVRRVSMIEENVVTVDALFNSNENITGAYFVRTIGLTVLSEGKEVLFAAAVEKTENPAYMTPTSASSTAMEVKFSLKLNNTDMIEIVTNTAGMATIHDVAEISDALSRHSDNEDMHAKKTEKELWNTVSDKASLHHIHENEDIKSLDASKITSGTIDIARLPQGALDRLIKVKDDDARFKLTKTDVQLGDTVKVIETNKMYIVTDENNLSLEDGYEPYTADTAASVLWSGVTEKPDTFPPSSHTHDYLPLSGGTMTGEIKKNGNAVVNTGTSNSTNFCGGTNLSTGAALILRGNSQSGCEGFFELRANNTSDSSKSIGLIGKPDGTLTWKGSPVLRADNYMSYAAEKGHTHDLNGLINNLGTGTATPVDADYCIIQNENGGTTNTNYCRKPISALYSYIKEKLDSVYQAKGSYASASHTHSYLPLSGGTMTGEIKKNGNAVVNTGTSNSTNFCGGTNLSTGAGLILRGNSQSGCEGFFELRAMNADSSASLLGKPDGTLTWKGSPVLRADNYTSYAAEKGHTHDYLPLSGGTLVGDVTLSSANANKIIMHNTIGYADKSISVKNADSMANIFPTSDLSVSLGTSTSERWKNVYAQYMYVSSGTAVTSDRNLKNTISELDAELSKELILQLKPSSYKYNESDSDRTHYGLIAQDVEETLENIGLTSKDFAGLVIERVNEDGGERTYALRYEEFIAPLIKVVQMQEEELNRQCEDIANLKERLSNVEEVLVKKDL